MMRGKRRQTAVALRSKERSNAIHPKDLERESESQRNQTEEQRRRTAEQDRIGAEAVAQVTTGLTDGLNQLAAAI